MLSNGITFRNVSESTQEEKQENFSLEQKSKSSRKRVHYMKFTKGEYLTVECFLAFPRKVVGIYVTSKCSTIHSS